MVTKTTVLTKNNQKNTLNMSKIKRTPFSTDEALDRVQREIICALLRLIPRETTVVPIRKMHRYLNPDSGLPDGYLVESVQLVNNGHDVQVVIRKVDYETLDQTIHDVSEVDESNNTQYLMDKTETFILESLSDVWPDEWIIENIALLKLIYDETEKTISEK